MGEKCTFIDFDGVILDSEERNHKGELHADWLADEGEYRVLLQ